MNMVRIFLAATILLMPSLPLHAGPAEDGRAWFNLTAEGDISDKVRWYLELQPRIKEEGSEFDQYLVRPGIHFKLGDKALLGGGYAYIRTRTSQGYTDEDRVWQQLIYNTTLASGMRFSSRSRLEQRFLETGDDTGWRYRQLLRISKPLQGSPNISPVMWNELFINLRDTDWGAQQGFNQNRLFAGAAWKVTSDARVEIGYINQYIRSPSRDSMNHILSTSLFLNF